MKINSQINTQNPAAAQTHRRLCRTNGLSIIEILIALSIAALLLTATATAFDAAFRSYKTNHAISVTGVSCRNGLHQICSNIRSAWNDPAVACIVVSEDGNDCTLVDANGRDVEYHYDSVTRQIEVRIRSSPDPWSNWIPMIQNAYPIALDEEIFIALVPENPDLPAGTVGKVIVRFKIQCPDQGFCMPITASAVPRNVVYGL